MEVLESGDPMMHWDRKLSELASEPESLLYHTHFNEFLDDFSQDVLGQLLNDPFLSDRRDMMDVDLSPCSPAPLIQAEHSYSLCGDSRPQSPLTQGTPEDFNDELIAYVPVIQLPGPVVRPQISAQESRRKKKEYMDTLEKKVENCSTENCELRKKVEVLESTNRTLLQQLQRLQAMVSDKVPRYCKVASTQTGTCLMVVVLCFAVAFGSFSQNYGPYPSATKTVLSSQHSASESYAASIVRSRNLLIYEEARLRDEQHIPKGPADVWDRHVDQPLTAPLLQEARSGAHDMDSSFLISTETQLEKSILLELQHHRLGPDLGLNETLKIIGIDRSVNATS
ncbi:cyclic AMP-responsive element-binding protein 3-like protein 2 [Lissotriton helveticus]